jgi:hypothetical protein
MEAATAPRLLCMRVNVLVQIGDMSPLKKNPACKVASPLVPKLQSISVFPVCSFQVSLKVPWEERKWSSSNNYRRAAYLHGMVSVAVKSNIPSERSVQVLMYVGNVQSVKVATASAGMCQKAKGWGGLSCAVKARGISEISLARSVECVFHSASIT